MNNFKTTTTKGINLASIRAAEYMSGLADGINIFSPAANNGGEEPLAATLQAHADAIFAEQGETEDE